MAGTLKTIGLDEWRDELEKAAKAAYSAAEGFLSTEEMRATNRFSENTIKRMLRAAKTAGRLEFRPARREGIDGRLHFVTVYRIAPAKKGRS